MNAHILAWFVLLSLAGCSLPFGGRGSPLEAAYLSACVEHAKQDILKHAHAMGWTDSQIEALQRQMYDGGGLAGQVGETDGVLNTQCRRYYDQSSFADKLAGTL